MNTATTGAIAAVVIGLVVTSFALAVTSYVKVTQNTIGNVFITENINLSGTPVNFDAQVNVENFFNINQYVFIENAGTFIVNSINGKTINLFNLPALSVLDFPSGARIYPAGQTISSRTTQAGNVTPGLFDVFVRDANPFCAGGYILMQTATSTVNLPIQSISSVSEIESKLTLSNDEGIDTLPFNILSKITPSGQRGLPGTGAGGGIAFLTQNLAFNNVEPGITPVTFDVDSNLYIYAPRASGVRMLVYMLVLIDGTIPQNLYFEVTSVNPSGLAFTAVLSPFINNPVYVTVNFDVTTDQPTVFLGGDTSGQLTLLQDQHILIGNGSGFAQEVLVSGDATLDNTGVLTISDDAVNTVKILNAAVTTSKLAENAVDNFALGDNSVGNSNLMDDAVDARVLADNTVTEPKIADNAVSTNKIGSLAVTSGKIADDAIVLSKMANNSVGTSELIGSSVTLAKMASNSVGTTQLVDGSVTLSKMASNSVDTTQLVNEAVTNDKIEPATITGGKIAAATITGSNIAAASITGSNIAATTITASNIANATITGAKIAAATITATNIANATITGAKIAATTITAGNILASTITGAKIAATTITAGNIANATITGAKIAATTITASNIANATITGAKIAPATITGSNIVNNTITGTQLNNIFGPGPNSYTNASITVDAQGRLITASSGSATAPLTTNEIFIGDGGNNAVSAAVTGDLSAVFSGGDAQMTIANNAVTTAKIVNGAITIDKMANNSVGTSQLVNDAVTNAKIANDAVDSPQLANSSVTTPRIAPDAVTTSKIVDAAVNDSKLATNSVTTDKIVDLNVTNAKLATDSVNTNKIVNQNVTAAKLAPNSVNTSKIVDLNVTNAKLATDSVTTDKIVDLNVTNAKLDNIGTAGIYTTVVTNAKGRVTLGAAYPTFYVQRGIGGNDAYTNTFDVQLGGSEQINYLRVENVQLEQNIPYIVLCVCEMGISGFNTGIARVTLAGSNFTVSQATFPVSPPAGTERIQERYAVRFDSSEQTTTESFMWKIVNTGVNTSTINFRIQKDPISVRSILIYNARMTITPVVGFTELTPVIQ